MRAVDVLIPTYRRPTALAVTLASLAAQTYRDFRVIVSDQTEDSNPLETGEIKTLRRVLELRGHETVLMKHLPRRGLAEQRQYLLDCSEAPLALFLDDDLVLEPSQIERLVLTLQEHECGFVGAAPIGLSYREDVRPHEQVFEPWEARVRPERVMPGSDEWRRHLLHNAANVLHVQKRLGLTETDRLPYKIAWIGGCVLYDAAKLRSVGGFGFWRDLPLEHCGEDVLAQLLVMVRYGGCGVLPSGVFHQELATTIPVREIDAPLALSSLLSD